VANSYRIKTRRGMQTIQSSLLLLLKRNEQRGISYKAGLLPLSNYLSNEVEEEKYLTVAT